jgi:hypothetical protein
MDVAKVLRWLFDHLGTVVTICTSGVGVAAIVLARLQDLPIHYLLLIVLGVFGLVFWGINSFRTFHKQKRGIADLGDKGMEKTIRDWLDDPSFTFKREDKPDCFFQFVVTDESQRPITVSRTKAKPTYLSISTAITLSDEHRQKYEALGRDQQDKIIHNLRIEMARYGIGYRGIKRGLERVDLADVVFLDNALTEFYLRQRIFYVTGAFALYAESIGQQLMTPI